MRTTTQATLTYLLLLLGISGSVLAPAQKDTIDFTTQLSSAALKEDVKVLRTHLEQLHINLHNYYPPTKMDAAFEQINQKIEQDRSVFEFFHHLSILNPIIANVHTKITPPTHLWNKIKQEQALFPFKVYWYKDQLYVLKNLSNTPNIPEGSLIKQINGRSATELFKEMTQLIQRDGYNQSYPIQRTCVSFDIIYAAHYGMPPIFELTLETPDGKPLTISTSALNKKDLEQNHLDRYQGPATSWEKTEEPALALRFEKDLAILQVKTFQESLIKDKGQNYKAFIKKAFKEIEDKGTKNLVLDIRGNSGGQPEPTELLLSYLLEEPFQLCEKIEAKISAIDDPSYFIKNGSIDYFENRPWQQQGEIFVLQDKRQFKTWKPNKNRYTGRLFMLTDGFTNSAAGTFAGQIKSQNRATIVGEETGGNPNFTVARIIPKFELPNSQIVVSLPLIASTKKVSFENTGHGVIPDHIIRPSVEHLLEKKDVVLAWVRQKIQSQ